MRRHPSAARRPIHQLAATNNVDTRLDSVVFTNTLCFVCVKVESVLKVDVVLQAAGMLDLPPAPPHLSVLELGPL